MKAVYGCISLATLLYYNRTWSSIRKLKWNILFYTLIVFITGFFYSFLLHRFATTYYPDVTIEDVMYSIAKICPTRQSPTNRKLCVIPSHYDVDLNVNGVLSKKYLGNMSLLKQISSGGEWLPKHCFPPYKVAIIVPYRDREEHLDIFLTYIHQFLNKQNVHYRIFLVEQSPLYPFNRGKLLNIGFHEVTKAHDFDCFIFHDVDLIPEKLENLYACSDQPRHMSSAVNTLRYNLPYTNLFGGVIAIKKSQFVRVNGFSNMFFGWGGEDDDLYNRLQCNDINIVRWDPSITRYVMLKHRKEPVSHIRYKLLSSANYRYGTDGINNLKYNRIKIENKPLYTWIFVDVN